MKIAAIGVEGRGETDRLISQAAAELEKRGLRLSGIAKVLQELPDGSHQCDMDVRVFPGTGTIRITQSLGQGSTGCRLNPAAIAEAVSSVEESIGSDKADLFVLNKFGPEEAEGRGFRAAIATALEQDVPVLVGLSGGAANKAAFAEFSAGLAEQLPADVDAVVEWCLAAQKV
ncbi:MAG: DUF2478 domain-containing protein [Pelagimonas sp.]|uniref:DUF2478 domain-containing protein n=1 Tax=Pelagimonas sp. TaxID=2073170 RepID=UPI003D6B6F66